jgi:hypothetical protein
MVIFDLPSVDSTLSVGFIVELTFCHINANGNDLDYTCSNTETEKVELTMSRIWYSAIVAVTRVGPTFVGLAYLL